MRFQPLHLRPLQPHRRLVLHHPRLLDPALARLPKPQLVDLRNIAQRAPSHPARERERRDGGGADRGEY